MSLSQDTNRPFYINSSKPRIDPNALNAELFVIIGSVYYKHAYKKDTLLTWAQLHNTLKNKYLTYPFSGYQTPEAPHEILVLEGLNNTLEGKQEGL